MKHSKVEIEHGTMVGYQHHKCRCKACKITATFTVNCRQQRKNNVRPDQPELAAGWKAAVESGQAEAFADRIIEVRPVPIKLLRAIARAGE